MPNAIRTHRPKQPGRRHVPDAEARRLRSSGRYRKFQAWYMGQHPLCADPFGVHAAEHRVVASEQLHHRVKVQDAPDRLCDADNAMALCVACHTRIEQHA